MPPKQSGSGGSRAQAKRHHLHRAQQAKRRAPSSSSSSSTSHAAPHRNFTSQTPTGPDHPHVHTAGRSGGGQGTGMRHDTTRRRAAAWNDAHANPDSSFLSDSIASSYRRTPTSDMFEGMDELDHMLSSQRDTPRHEYATHKESADGSWSLDDYARSQPTSMAQHQANQSQYAKDYLQEQNDVYQRNYRINERDEYEHDSGLSFPKPPQFDLNSGRPVSASTGDNTRHTAGIGLDGDNIDDTSFKNKSSFKNPFWDNNNTDRPISPFDRKSGNADDSNDIKGESFTMKNKYNPNQRGSLDQQRAAFEDARQDANWDYTKYGDTAWDRNKERKEQRHGYTESLEGSFESGSRKRREDTSSRESTPESRPEKQKVQKKYEAAKRPQQFKFFTLLSTDAGKFQAWRDMYQKHFDPFGPGGHLGQKDFERLKHHKEHDGPVERKELSSIEKYRYEEDKQRHHREQHTIPEHVKAKGDIHHQKHKNVERQQELSKLTHKIEILRSQVDDLDELQSRVSHLRKQFYNSHGSNKKDWLAAQKTDSSLPFHTQIGHAAAKESVRAQSNAIRAYNESKNVHRVVDSTSNINTSIQHTNKSTTSLLHDDDGDRISVTPDKNNISNNNEHQQQGLEQFAAQQTTPTAQTVQDTHTTATNDQDAPRILIDKKPPSKRLLKTKSPKKFTNTSLSSPLKVNGSTLIIPRSTQSTMSVMNKHHTLLRTSLLNEISQLTDRLNALQFHFRVRQILDDEDVNDFDDIDQDQIALRQQLKSEFKNVVLDDVEADKEFAILERKLNNAFARLEVQMDQLKTSYDKVLNINRVQDDIEQNEQNEYMKQRQLQYQKRQQHIEQAIEEQENHQLDTLDGIDLQLESTPPSPVQQQTPVEIQPLFTSVVGIDKPISSYSNPLSMPTSAVKTHQLNPKDRQDAYRLMVQQAQNSPQIRPESLQLSPQGLDSPIITGLKQPNNMRASNKTPQSSRASPANQPSDSIQHTPILGAAIKQISQYNENRASPYFGARQSPYQSSTPTTTMDFTPTFTLGEAESESILQTLKHHRVRGVPTPTSANNKNTSMLYNNALYDDETTVSNFNLDFNPLLDSTINMKHRSSNLPQIVKPSSTTFLPPPNFIPTHGINDNSPILGQNGLNKNNFIPPSPQIRTSRSPDQQQQQQHPIVEIQPMQQVMLSDIDPASNFHAVENQHQIFDNTNYRIAGIDPTLVNQVRFTHRPDQPDQISAVNDLLERGVDTML